MQESGSKDRPAASSSGASASAGPVQPPHLFASCVALPNRAEELLGRVLAEVTQQGARVNALAAQVEQVAARVAGFVDVVNTRLEKFLAPPQLVLPTEIVAMVLRRLETADLMRASGVCRQWRDVARSPALWRTRSLPLQPTALRSRVLRLAPCLQDAALGVRDLGSAALEESLGRCRIKKLTLDLHDARDPIVERAVRLLRQQAQLGELRSVDLRKLPPRGARRLVVAAQDPPISELRIGDRWNVKPRDYVSAQPMPGACALRASCLKRFKFSGDTPDPIIEDMLQVHSATLECVSLKWWRPSQRGLELLGSCTQLQEAEVPPVAAAAILRGCPLFRRLQILVNAPVTLELLTLFKGAVQLTELTLDEGTDLHKSAFQLLACLGLSHQSALRMLCFQTFGVPDLISRLPGILPGLPNLHTLVFKCLVPVIVLAAITPACIPSLRLLVISEYDSELCIDLEECYMLAAIDFLRRNPHVHGKIGHHDDVCSDEDCACCKAGIHEEIRRFGNCEGLFGHDPSVMCDLKDHVDAPQRWMHVT